MNEFIWLIAGIVAALAIGLSIGIGISVMQHNRDMRRIGQ